MENHDKLLLSLKEFQENEPDKRWLGVITSGGHPVFDPERQCVVHDAQYFPDKESGQTWFEEQSVTRPDDPLTYSAITADDIVRALKPEIEDNCRFSHMSMLELRSNKRLGGYIFYSQQPDPASESKPLNPPRDLIDIASFLEMMLDKVETDVSGLGKRSWKLRIVRDDNNRDDLAVMASCFLSGPVNHALQ